MTPPSIFTDRRVVVATALLCAFLWGSAVPALKAGYGLFAIDPADTPTLLLFAGLRFVLAGLILLGFAAATGRGIGLDRRALARVSLLGLVSTAVQYLFYYVGVAHSTGVKVSIVTSISTFFSVLLAHVVYADDKLTRQRLIGCLIGFAGVVTVNLSAGGLDLTVSFLGEGFIIIAALMFTLSGMYGKRLTRQMDPIVMTGWQLALGGLLLIGAGTATGGQLAPFGIDAALVLAYLSALSAAAFTLWSVLMKHNPVGAIAIFNTLIPVFGVLLSGLVLGESIFEWKNLAALLLVSTGILLVTATRRR